MSYPSCVRMPSVEVYKKSVAYRIGLEADIKCLESQVERLLEALYRKYLEAPDPQTEMILIGHEKLEPAQSGRKDER